MSDPRSILDRLDAKEARPTKLKALFYGAPGTGKTELLGTAPRLLLLDADGGGTTVRDNKNVTFWRIRTWQDLNDAVYTLMFEPHSFESVGLDTVTTLQLIAEEEVGLVEVLDKNEDPRRAYSRTAAMIRHKLMLLTQLDMHVLFTAHMKFNEGPEAKVDPEEGRFRVIPDIQPSVQRAAFALPDVIGRTFLKDMGGGEFKHAIAFGPDGQGVSKERNFGLPKEAAGLTIPHLIRQVTTGTRTKETNNA